MPARGCGFFFNGTPPAMMKLLRRHSKLLLALFGSLLMVVFLVPELINRFAQQAGQSNAPWAEAGDEELSRDLFDRSVRDLEILPRYLAAIGNQNPILNAASRDPVHWYLLARDAEMAGLVGGRGTDQVSPEVAAFIFAGAQLSRENDEALARCVGVVRLLNLWAGAVPNSDHRLRGQAQRKFHGVEARLAVIEAEVPADAPMPSEADIAAQYEKYRDVAPGMDSEYGFGYLQPNRFNLEYMVVPFESIRDAVRASGRIDDIALFEHWETQQTAEGFPEVKFDEPVPAVVRDSLVDKIATEMRGEIEKNLASTLLLSKRGLSLDDDGYAQLDDDWATTRPRFADLADNLQESFPTLVRPTYVGIGNRWLVPTDLQTEEAVVGAATDRYGTPVTLVQLVAQAKEFGGGPFVVQAGVTGPLLRTPDGDVVVFRMTEADASRPPNDLAEVRDDVIEDLQRLAAYNDLAAQTDELRDRVANEGVLGVAVDYDLTPRVVTVTENNLDQFELFAQAPQFARPSSLPVIGPHVPTIDAIVDVALALPADPPLAGQPLSDRAFAVDVPDYLCVVVGELRRQTMLDAERFNTLTGTRQNFAYLLFAADDEDLQSQSLALANAFSLETLMDRHAFRVLTRESDEEAAEETDDSAGDDEPVETAAAE